MSTPTEYRLLKERHEALVAAVRELADEWESDADEHMDAFGQHLPAAVSRMAELLRERLLEGETR